MTYLFCKIYVLCLSDRFGINQVNEVHIFEKFAWTLHSSVFLRNSQTGRIEQKTVRLKVQENKLIGKNLHKTYKSSQNFNQILTFKSTLGLCGSSTNETIGKSLFLQFCRRLSSDMTSCSCHFDFLKLFYIGIA